MECRAEQVGVCDLYAEGMRLEAAGSLHEAGGSLTCHTDELDITYTHKLANYCVLMVGRSVKTKEVRKHCCM